jgi:thioredoxin 1
LTTTETESQIIEKYDDMDIIVDPVGLKEISDDEFNTEVLSHAGISVVLFSSHWCQPCRSMQMVVEAAKNSVVLRNENVKYLTIDTDENPLSSSEFQLRSIPSTLIFKNGRVVSDIIGLSSVSAVISEVQKHTLLNLPDIKVSSFE